MMGFVFGGIFGLVLGLVLGVLSTFDWEAYFKYKKDIVEMGMKYEKEMRNE